MAALSIISRLTQFGKLLRKASRTILLLVVVVVGSSISSSTLLGGGSSDLSAEKSIYDVINS